MRICDNFCHRVFEDLFFNLGPVPPEEGFILFLFSLQDRLSCMFFFPYKIIYLVCSFLFFSFLFLCFSFLFFFFARWGNAFPPKGKDGKVLFFLFNLARLVFSPLDGL